MPKVTFNGFEMNCKTGDNLRTVIRRHGHSPYNGLANYLNCHGLGTCGTCAVDISGRTSGKTKVERWRLDFPPHQSEDGLRLACQCKVLGDLEIRKHDGFWGEKIKNEEDPGS